MDEEAINPARERQEADEYSYEVLTTEQILLHMNECMREVYLESPPREVDVKCIQSLEIMKDNDLFFPFDFDQMEHPADVRHGVIRSGRCWRRRSWFGSGPWVPRSIAWGGGGWRRGVGNL